MSIKLDNVYVLLLQCGKGEYTEFNQRHMHWQWLKYVTSKVARGVCKLDWKISSVNIVFFPCRVFCRYVNIVS